MWEKEPDWKKIYTILSKRSKNPQFHKWNDSCLKKIYQYSFANNIDVPIYIKHKSHELLIMWLFHLSDKNPITTINNDIKKNIMNQTVHYQITNRYPDFPTPPGSPIL